MATGNDYPSSDSDEQSFKSLSDTEEPSTTKSTTSTSNSKPLSSQPPAQQARFPPEEEASLLKDSTLQKQKANSLFGSGSYENALQQYDQALSLCPNYLDYEIAILRSNTAACYIKLREWKAAVEAATKGLDCLERLEPLPNPPKNKKEDEEAGKDGGQGRGGGVVEVTEETEARMKALEDSGHSLSEVQKLQTKLLLRRAKARTEQPSWTDLQAASEDYSILLSPSLQASLSDSDKKSILANSRALTPKLNEAREREVAEMMGKLKGLGNSILKPFGLSTENFQFNKDEKSGGYSMNFEQNPGKK